MAGETGLEPAAFAVTGRRYNQLNYSPAFVFMNILVLSVFVKKIFYFFRNFLNIFYQ